MQTHLSRSTTTIAATLLLLRLRLLLLQLLTQLPNLRLGIALPVPAVTTTTGGRYNSPSRVPSWPLPGGALHLPADVPRTPRLACTLGCSLVIQPLQAVQRRNLGEIGRQVEQLSIGGAREVCLHHEERQQVRRSGTQEEQPHCSLSPADFSDTLPQSCLFERPDD